MRLACEYYCLNDSMKQIVLVVDNRPGAIASISELMGKRGINIESLTGDTIGNFGVLTLMVDRTDLAAALLKDAGYDPKVEDSLVVLLPDEPGALAGLSKRFLDADINIRSIRVIRRDESGTMVAISSNKTEEAVALVKDIIYRP